MVGLWAGTQQFEAVPLGQRSQSARLGIIGYETDDGGMCRARLLKDAGAACGFIEQPCPQLVHRLGEVEDLDPTSERAER